MTPAADSGRRHQPQLRGIVAASRQRSPFLRDGEGLRDRLASRARGDPRFECVATEAHRTVGTAEPDAWDPTVLGGGVEPRARNAEELSDLAWAKQSQLCPIHTVHTLLAAEASALAV